MEAVTDVVFRQILYECGKPDVMFTEFTNVEGMYSKGRDQVVHRLLFEQNHHPIVAQVWGKSPEHYLKATQEIVDLGFDGIDINMGCPEANVLKGGSCAALINNHPLAHEIIIATQEGAGHLPVSVKTRIGVKNIVTEEWISFLLSHNLAALTVHGRTAAEMSKVPNHWDEIGKTVGLRNHLNPATMLIGNGDVVTHQQALDMIETYGLDGVMIGRGIFQNPWIFNPAINPDNVSSENRVRLLIRHVELFDQIWHESKHFDILKKFFKIYINGFPGAHELRVKFMESQTPEQALQIAHQSLKD